MGIIQTEEAQLGILIENCLAKNQITAKKSSLSDQYHKYHGDTYKNASILRNSNRNSIGRHLVYSCLYKREKKKKLR